MIPVIFNSLTAYLIDDPPYRSESKLTASLPTHAELGITARETRRTLGDTLRLQFTFDVYLERGAVPAFRNSLQELSTEKVLCPLWPAMFAPADGPVVESAYYVLIGDGAAPEIKPAGDLPFDRWACPLMVGRLESRPDPQLLTDEEAFVTIEFVENDASSLTFPEVIPPSGLAAAGTARPLFPWRPNWAKAPTSGGSTREIERRQIGQGRETADAYFEQPSRRTGEQQFTFEGAEAWQCLRLFQDLGAVRANFWLPAGISDARLTADVAALDEALAVDEPTARGDNTAYLLDDLVHRTCVSVTGTVDDTWTLSGAVGQAYAAGRTRLESLFLARLASNKLGLSFRDLGVAEASIKFLEVQGEAVEPDGETVGTTIGALPTSAWLYVFTVAYPGAPQTWRYTDFERNLANGGHTYTHALIEHGPIRESATLQREKVSLKCRNWTNTPFALLIPFLLEWPMQAEIYECDVDGNNATNLRCLFRGEVGDASDVDPPYLNIEMASLSSLFDRKVPRLLISPSCSLDLFEPLCGMDEDDWKWQGTVVSFDAETGELVVDTISKVGGGSVSLTAHYFAGGYVIANTQYRMVGDSTAESGGSLTLVVSNPFGTAPALGSTVIFHPGCDGLASTCVGKFNNYGRFGGAPFAPVGNPSLVRLSKKVTGGGKK